MAGRNCKLATFLRPARALALGRALIYCLMTTVRSHTRPFRMLAGSPGRPGDAAPADDGLAPVALEWADALFLRRDSLKCGGAGVAGRQGKFGQTGELLQSVA